MASDALVSEGGWAPPTLMYHSADAIEQARFTYEVLPVFRALSAGFDFRPSHVRWAEARELELREERQARESEREQAAIDWPW